MGLFSPRKPRDVGATIPAPGPGYAPQRPTGGAWTWTAPASPSSLERGMPVAQAGTQRRDPAFHQVAPFGGVIWAHTRPYDRGSAAYVPRFGVPFSNPIGAGVVARHRPLPYYGPAGVYVNHQIFWVPQTISTSVPTSPLQNPAVLAALLGAQNVQAAVRTG